MYTLPDGRRIYEKSEIDTIQQVLDNKINDNEHNAGGMLDDAVSDLNQKIADETTAREEGDDARYTKEETDARIHEELLAAGQVSPGDLDDLDTRLAAEAVLREAEDTRIREMLDEESNTLSGKIADEAEAREQFDTHLDTLIGDETRARKQADNTLQDNINVEAEAREQADGDLQDKIDAEMNTRADADNDLHGKIDAEAKMREDADKDLQDKIDNIRVETLTEAEVNKIFKNAFGIAPQTRIYLASDFTIAGMSAYDVLANGGCITFECIGTMGYAYPVFSYDPATYTGVINSSELEGLQFSRLRMFRCTPPSTGQDEDGQTYVFQTWTINNFSAHRFTGTEEIYITLDNGNVTSAVME